MSHTLNFYQLLSLFLTRMAQLDIRIIWKLNCVHAKWWLYFFFNKNWNCILKLAEWHSTAAAMNERSIYVKIKRRERMNLNCVETDWHYSSRAELSKFIHKKMWIFVAQGSVCALDGRNKSIITQIVPC